MNLESCPQILDLGEPHTGEGLCLCTVDQFGDVELDEDSKPINHPGCPLTGHSNIVSRVLFTNDGKQVISSGNKEVRVWDVASGRQVRQVAGGEFALVGGLSDEHKKSRHVLTADGDTLLIYEIGNEEQHAGDGAAAAPEACFKAPQRIISVRCFGSTICVGCFGGAVCLLSAPFLAA